MEWGLGLRLHPNYYALAFYLLQNDRQFFLTVEYHKKLIDATMKYKD
jgi:hypothetical protein